MPKGTLLLIGPQAMDMASLKSEPNVVYLGPIPYSELPEYASAFDVAIMPWLKNEWMEAASPIKLKEYLALGRPVVSIRFPELKPYESLIYAADSHEEFLCSLDAALGEDDPSLLVERRKAVANSSWDTLAEKVARLFSFPESPRSIDWIASHSKENLGSSAYG